MHVKRHLYVSDGITLETAGHLFVIFSNKKFQTKTTKLLLSSYVCVGVSTDTIDFWQTLRNYGGA
jgi:hypothetical protein